MDNTSTYEQLKNYKNRELVERYKRLNRLRESNLDKRDIDIEIGNVEEEIINRMFI